ncbi:MAG: recombinase family protein [Mogibacterium sp.]|nr:recombinase family protein [Mogibacterium sp.]
MPNVIVIPPKIDKLTAMPINSAVKRKVAGYARVSSDHEEQTSSYEAQVDYYTNYIKSRDDWEFAGIYTDEGISATNTHKREGFKTMIGDALAGKIDLIITKSVSRFARNTVDSLTTVRQLKDAGIEIYFEKENIWTLDAKGELLITIMSSLAQEESRSISENVTWGHRKRFADGKVSFTYSRFLGLDKDPETGKIVVNEEEAEIVRTIFGLFLQGLTPNAIATELTKRGVKTPGGKYKWYQGTVTRMLQNEKYKGDALLQKNVTTNYLTHKLKKNEGEAPQYYVQGNHEAIIDPEAFELVQAEFERRKKTRGRYSGVSIFSSKIKCGDCGEWYGAKVWHSNDPYRKVIYRCNRKYDDGHKCETPHVTEAEIKAAFVKAYNNLTREKDEVIADVREMKTELCMTEDLIIEKERLAGEMKTVAEKTHELINENARVAQDQIEYQKRFEEMDERCNGLQIQYDEADAAIKQKEALSIKLDEFVKAIESRDGVLEDFDETLWGYIVEDVTVMRGKEMKFRLAGGIEITV